MAALAHRKISEAFSAKPAPRLAREGDEARATAVHHQRRLIEQAFAENPYKRYPGPVRLALCIGAPTALWAGVLVGGAQLLRLAHF
jgi:hypothetical protein